MTGKDHALASLKGSGLLDVLAWAAPVAFARTGQDYDEEAGHDQAIVGLHNFVYLCNLLDRATSNRHFFLEEGVETGGLDLLRRGIAPEAYRSMPVIPHGAIVRSDYKQSPGWAADGYRVLLQSFKFGEVDRLKWGDRSEAKREVASQTYVSQDTLFSDEILGMEKSTRVSDDDCFEGVTLIAAHSYEPITGKFELYIGQSKNPMFRGDSCWHWRHQLVEGGTTLQPSELYLPPILVGDAPTLQVAEIDVQLRKTNEENGSAISND